MIFVKRVLQGFGSHVNVPSINHIHVKLSLGHILYMLGQQQSKGADNMFHRVKSEAPEEQTPEAAKPDVDNTPKQDNSVKVVQPAQKAQPTENAAEANTISQPSATENTKKDTSPMTDQDNTEAETKTNEAPVSTYQRTTGQAPVRAAGSTYPGSYGGSSYGAGASDGSASDRRLTIGSGITMSGEIESCDYLLVEGTVEAALKGANMLDVAESGVFYGTVEIGEATIAGRFEGDITVNGRLTVTSTGTVTGSISYKELEIQAGAVIDGKLTPVSGTPAAAKKPSAAKPAATKPAAQKEKSQEPANNDGELFTKAAAAAE